VPAPASAAKLLRGDGPSPAASGWIRLSARCSRRTSCPTRIPASPAARALLAEFGFDRGSGATPQEIIKALQKACDKQVATLCALGVKPLELAG